MVGNGALCHQGRGAIREGRLQTNSPLIRNGYKPLIDILISEAPPLGEGLKGGNKKAPITMAFVILAGGVRA